MRILRILRESGLRRTLNSVVNYSEYRRRRQRLHSMPTAVDIEVTNRCPLACIHCPRTYRDRLGFPVEVGDINRERALSLLRELRGIRRVAFQGYGEPLVYPHLFDLLAEARRLRIYSTFSTSAAVVSRPIVDGLCENPPDLLTFSCDVVEMRYDEGVRRNLNLDLFRENVSAIVRAVRSSGRGTVILMHTCLVGKNHRMLESIVRFAAEMGIPSVDMSELNLSYLWQWRDALLPPSREAMLADVDASRRVGKDLGVRASLTPQMELPDELRRGCRYLWQHPFVTWQGELTPCCARPFAGQFTFGNVFRTPFSKLWNGEAIREMRKAQVGGCVPTLCNGCPYAPA